MKHGVRVASRWGIETDVLVTKVPPDTFHGGVSLTGVDERSYCFCGSLVLRAAQLRNAHCR